MKDTQLLFIVLELYKSFMLIYQYWENFGKSLQKVQHIFKQNK
jgi:hypothetical protein